MKPQALTAAQWHSAPRCTILFPSGYAPPLLNTPSVCVSRHRYTVFYNRAQDKVMHVLAGTVTITNPQRGEVWIDVPQVVITTRKGQQQKIAPKNCPAVVPGRRQQVECKFEAHWYTEKYPRTGNVKAVVTYAERDADEEEAAAADVFESARVPFDFAKTKLQQAVGSAALVETFWAPAAAGQGILQPTRSTGEKPYPGERIGGSWAFKFTAVIEPGPTSQSQQLCARPWKVRGSRLGCRR